MSKYRHTWMVCRDSECRKVFEVHGDGSAVCPECRTVIERDYAREKPNNLALQAQLYGTDGNPKWNQGLGVWTRGKQDRRLQASAKQMVPYDE